MAEDHEEAGYEFEKGRQRLLAEQEAEHRAYANQKRSQVRKKCCKGFRRVILAAFIYFLGFVLGSLYVVLNDRIVFSPEQGEFIEVPLENDFWLYLTLGGSILFALIAPVLAFIGAMNMLCGCIMGLTDD